MNVLGPMIYRLTCVELNLTRLFEELLELFYFMLHVPSQAISTGDLTILLALMKFRA